MSKPEELISQETLQRIVARAVELDERRRDRVNLATARDIARELGISEEAWDTAVLEYRRSRSNRPARSARLSALRTGFMAALGLVAGAASASFATVTDDVAAGAVLVAWSILFAIRARRSTAPNVVTQLGAWWAAVPVGIMLARGEVLTDPIWFAALSFVGSAAQARFMLPEPHGDGRSGPPSSA